MVRVPPLGCDTWPSQRGYVAGVAVMHVVCTQSFEPPVKPQELELDQATGMKVSRLVPG